MSTESSAKQLVSYSFLVVFANDKTIDENELRMIKKLALEDNEIDEHERKVLRNIFARVSEDTVEPNVWEDILAFRARYDI